MGAQDYQSRRAVKLLIYPRHGSQNRKKSRKILSCKSRLERTSLLYVLLVSLLISPQKMAGKRKEWTQLQFSPTYSSFWQIPILQLSYSSETEARSWLPPPLCERSLTLNTNSEQLHAGSNTTLYPLPTYSNVFFLAVGHIIFLLHFFGLSSPAK